VSSIRARSFTAFVFLLLAALPFAAGKAAGAPAAPVILVLGDSLSAGYGISVEQGWVALLQARLRSKGYGHRSSMPVRAAKPPAAASLACPGRSRRIGHPSSSSNSARTTACAGLPVGQKRSNLDSIIDRFAGAGAKILLVGMRIPPNYGPVYSESFRALFGDAAARHKVPLVPFLLQKVALDDSMVQQDGLHPNAAAQPALLDTVWPQLEPLLRRK
jgi:acyl-CoA thioesterase-1